LRDPRILGTALVLSVVILLLSASTNYLLFRAFHLTVPPVAALLVLLVLQVGSAPVSTPGNLGVFQYLRCSRSASTQWTGRRRRRIRWCCM